jgi:hypothetical protein
MVLSRCCAHTKALNADGMTANAHKQQLRNQRLPVRRQHALPHAVRILLVTGIGLLRCGASAAEGSAAVQVSGAPEGTSMPPQHDQPGSQAADSTPKEHFVAHQGGPVLLLPVVDSLEGGIVSSPSGRALLSSQPIAIWAQVCICLPH